MTPDLLLRCRCLLARTLLESPAMNTPLLAVLRRNVESETAWLDALANPNLSHGETALLRWLAWRVWGIGEPVSVTDVASRATDHESKRVLATLVDDLADLELAVVSQ